MSTRLGHRGKTASISTTHYIWTHHLGFGLKAHGRLTSSHSSQYNKPAAAARAASPRDRAAAWVSSELIGRGMVDGGGGRQRRQWRCSGGGGGNSDDSGRNKKVPIKLLFYADATSDLAMRRVSLLRGSLWELVGMCTILRGQASCLNFFNNFFRTLGLSKGNTKNKSNKFENKAGCLP